MFAESIKSYTIQEAIVTYKADNPLPTLQTIFCPTEELNICIKESILVTCLSTTLVVSRKRISLKPLDERIAFSLTAIELFLSVGL